MHLENRELSSSSDIEVVVEVNHVRYAQNHRIEKIRITRILHKCLGYHLKRSKWGLIIPVITQSQAKVAGSHF